MSTESDIPTFPELNLVIATLQENGYFRDKDPADLKIDNEFQVFRIIGENKVISTEAITEKFETSQSLSMILSNLQADELISQTSDYKWRPSEKIIEILQRAVNEAQYIEREKAEEQEDRERRVQIHTKKSLYKRIADQLVGSDYVPPNHTVEDLFKIPEMEILAIMYENQPIGADQLEDKTTLDSSVSLSLSNLQADQIIKQNAEYKWELSDTLMSDLESSRMETVASTGAKEQHDALHPVQSQAKIIEHKQLLKAVLDIDYFKDKRIEDILATPEFEILNIINSYSPITTEEIEENLTQETLLSLQLSNLSADNLIEQTNDIRWVLQQDFRSRVSKVKVSQDEIMEHITSLERPDDTIDETTEDPGPSVPSEDQQDAMHADPQGQKKSKTSALGIDPMIKLLSDNQYLSDPDLEKSELMKIPEYEVLNVIRQSQPISADEIDRITSTSSISLTLSNLQADEIIRQTNDYRYELADHLGELLNSETQGPEEIQDKSPSPHITPSDDPEEPIMVLDDRSQPKSYKNLAVACFKAGYIKERDTTEKDLNAVPEFEVLQIIGDSQPIDESSIKEEATSVSPVLISRTLSKLQAENRISRTSDDRWQYTDAFEQLLIEDELAEQKRLAEIQAKKEEMERKLRMAEERDRREKFVNLLKSEGIVDQEDTQEKLMQIPEFEILWIISQSETELSETEIKEKAESTSPVLITRTISQLETKGRIQKTLAGKYELSSDLKRLD